MRDFAAVHESGFGTTQTFRVVRSMSVVEGISGTSACPAGQLDGQATSVIWRPEGG
jgi:hypothetical protein